jgi:small subunit ribosomal protein S13
MNVYNFMIIIFLLKGFVISDVRIKRRIDSNINFLIDVNSYKGVRHKMTLPVHGQRTRTNANTQRSKRIRIRTFNKGI